MRINIPNKKIMSMFLVILFICVAVVVFVYSQFSGDVYKGDRQKHFRDGEFFMENIEQNDKNFIDVMNWVFSRGRKQVEWVGSYGTSTVGYTPILPGSTRITFINHATTLIEGNGTVIITDPIFTKRASPVSFAGPKRYHDPYILLKDIPQIDIVLISHSHYDHLSIDSIKEIEKQAKPKYIVPLNNSQFIKKAGVPSERITELDLEESVRIEHGPIITLEKAQHWTARIGSDRNRYLWGSYMIQLGGKHIYFAGDTGYNSHFKEILNKHTKVDVALLPIGAYEPRWFMKTQHMNPSEAVMAASDLKSTYNIGIHFGTFQLTDEGRYDPEKELYKAVEDSGFQGHFLVPTIENGLEVVL
jgi:L-ascorbate metabolism protein UlaG (beta-lactamase superfamily)